MAQDDPVTLSLPHRLWRLLPRRARRAVLARAAASLAPAAGPYPPGPPGGGAVIGGELRRASGLGEGARLMRAALAAAGRPALGVEAALGPADAALPDDGLIGLDAAPPGLPLILHVNAPSLPAVLLRLPRASLRGRAIAGYWAWELATCPAEWRHAARHVHQVWVPSRFTATALAPVYGDRVRVVPHALAAAPMQDAGTPAPAMTRADFGLPAEGVLVLASASLASGEARKNLHGAIRAFRDAFGPAATHVLAIKTTHAAHDLAALAALRAAAGGAPNIHLITATLPADANRALTGLADIVISLHRSEGFGLVPAEAMLAGRAVIATNYGGVTDFIDDGCAVPIGFRLVPARDDSGVYGGLGDWADPDHADAVEALRHLAGDAAARARLGAAAQARARTAFSAAPLLAALDALASAA